MDTVDQIIAYECGQMDDTQMVDFFASLVKSGMAWQLQGHYGRTACHLIDQGFITEDGEVTTKLSELIKQGA